MSKLDRSKFTKSDMKFSEAETIFNSGNLKEIPLDTLVEMQGVYNKVKTGVSDKERVVLKELESRAEIEGVKKIKQLDFDSVVISTEFKELEDFGLKVPVSKFLKAVADVGLDPMDFHDSKFNKQKVFDAYTEGKLPSSLTSLIRHEKQIKLAIDRIKTEDKGKS